VQASTRAAGSTGADSVEGQTWSTPTTSDFAADEKPPDNLHEHASTQLHSPASTCVSTRSLRPSYFTRKQLRGPSQPSRKHIYGPLVTHHQLRLLPNLVVRGQGLQGATPLFVLPFTSCPLCMHTPPCPSTHLLCPQPHLVVALQGILQVPV
jgi:hypothetical protein